MDLDDIRDAFPQFDRWLEKHFKILFFKIECNATSEWIVLLQRKLNNL